MSEETDNVEDFLRFVNFCWCATHSWRFGHDIGGFDMVLSGGAVDSFAIPHHDIDFLCIDPHRVALPSNVHLSKEQTEGKDVLCIQSSLTSNDIHPGYARLSQYGSETLLSSTEVKKPWVDKGCFHALTRSPALALNPDDPNLPVIVVEEEMAVGSLVDKSINASKRYLNELRNATSMMELAKHSATTLNRIISAESNPCTSNLNHQQLDRQLEEEPRECNNKPKSDVFVNSFTKRIKEMQELLGTSIARSRFNTDYVPYIRCPVWPHEADEWVTRVRTRNWPQRSLINQCVADGCGFVAAAHTNTSADLADLVDDFDFRFSFSFAERRLLNSWLPIQRLIYTLLKEEVFEVNKQFDKESRILCSYHKKTLMLWFAETKPPEYWSSENLVSTLEELLLEMAKCLIERQLSQYFIPSNNLFDRPFNSDILDRTLGTLFVAAENIEKCSSALFFAYFFTCVDTPTILVPRSFMIKSSIAWNPAATVKNMAVTYELNDLFCGLSLLGQVSERCCSDLQPRSYSEQSLVTISEFLLAATNDHFGSVKRSCSPCKSPVDNSRRLFGRYSRRLNPSMWRRGFVAKESLKMQKINAENDSCSSSSMEISSHTEPISDKVSNTINGVQLMQGIRSYRLSRILSTAYFANFHYKVCQDYKAAIEIINEELKETYIPFLTCWHIPLSTEWSCIFDDDVQAMLGLALLYESVRTNAIAATSLQSEPMTVDYEDFYIPIPADVFLQYVTARCHIAIILREIISDCRLLSVNDVVERLSAICDTFCENTEPSGRKLECFYREGCRQCDDQLFRNDLSINFFFVTITKYSDSLLTILQTF